MNCQEKSLGLLKMLGYAYHHVIMKNHIATSSVHISMSVIRPRKNMMKIGDIK